MRTSKIFTGKLFITTALLLLLFPYCLQARFQVADNSANTVTTSGLAADDQSYVAREPSPAPADADMDWIQKILDNWSDLCRTELLLTVDTLPWIIFYDSASAWHLNAYEKMLPAFEKTRHRFRFAGIEFSLVKVPHSGNIWVPGRQAIPLSSSISATMPYADNSKAFFVAPLPSLFHTFAPADQSPYLDFLYLGINIHELTHTLQLPYVLPQLLKIEKAGNMESLDDNTVENIFSKNEQYKELYAKENKLLWRAAFITDRDSCLSEIKKALQLIETRKQQFFSREYRELGKADEIFLSLEGSAMWAQYRIMLKNAPNPNPEELLKWLVQQGPSWAQERGLVLFLLIDRFDPAWKPNFFGKPLPAATAHLRQVLKLTP